MLSCFVSIVIKWNGRMRFTCTA